ncbi:MAG UNVERIFIED_CONTAM: hypothetical protein LVR29_00350 [Microcystis novacekii LVE1205-3]
MTIISNGVAPALLAALSFTSGRWTTGNPYPRNDRATSSSFSRRYCPPKSHRSASPAAIPIATLAPLEIALADATYRCGVDDSLASL